MSYTQSRSVDCRPGVGKSVARRVRICRIHANFIRRQLEKGGMGGLGLSGRRLPQDLRGAVRQGRDFSAGTTDRPYGVEAVIRDNTGNWLVLVEPKEFTPEDFK